MFLQEKDNFKNHIVNVLFLVERNNRLQYMFFVKTFLECTLQFLYLHRAIPSMARSSRG